MRSFAGLDVHRVGIPMWVVMIVQAADGNCGPDAILRNLETMNLSCHHCQQILEVLRRRGRAAALQALRLKLLIWLRDHRGDEVLPGFRIICHASRYAL